MPDPVTRFTQLDVWKKAHRIVLEIYRRTDRFPVRERFGLVAQMRNAAVSAPANIAEGSARRRPGDKAHFYTIAISSAEEVRYYLVLCTDLAYLTADEAQRLDVALDEVCRMLFGMIDTWEARRNA
jgi:four helix bundle protein